MPSCKASSSILQEDQPLSKEGAKLGRCEVGPRRLGQDGHEDLSHLQWHQLIKKSAYTNQ